jgi:histidyl-tRNA synthetase
MDMLNLYPEAITSTVVQALVTVFNDELQNDSLKLAMLLRAEGIRTETYLDPRRGIGKQLGYADSKGIPLVVIAGPDEIEKGVAQVKRLSDSTEITIPLDKVGETARNLLGF